METKPIAQRIAEVKAEIQKEEQHGAEACDELYAELAALEERQVEEQFKHIEDPLAQKWLKKLMVYDDENLRGQFDMGKKWIVTEGTLLLVRDAPFKIFPIVHPGLTVKNDITSFFAYFKSKTVIEFNEDTAASQPFNDSEMLQVGKAWVDKMLLHALVAIQGPIKRIRGGGAADMVYCECERGTGYIAPIRVNKVVV